MKILFLLLSLLMCSCASIVKSDRQSVQFVGGPEGEIAKIQLPDGKHDLDGMGTIVVTRSKSDIPIKVTCNGVTSEGIIKTKYDIVFSGLGNLIFGGIIGWVVDATNDKGYNVTSPYNVSNLCADKQKVENISQMK